MGIEDRGFAGMDSKKQKKIASKGGITAHKNGTAHEWTREEAAKAGRLGGIASAIVMRRRRNEQKDS